MPNTIAVEITVARGDVTSFAADVLVLKYAQALHGADEVVYRRIESWAKSVGMPQPGQHLTIPVTSNRLAVGKVLFLGVVELYEFDYPKIRGFGIRAIEVVTSEFPEAVHIALTIHGPGYGLDETEAFESELAGVIEGLTSIGSANRIGRITFVEHNRGRAERLAIVLARLLPDHRLARTASQALRGLDEPLRATLRTAGYSAASKPRVFVAMPFAAEMDDVFHYGIQGASNAAGLLCERADLAAFTGDVMSWVNDRIANAKFVIADLTSANPNVYLEVGYACGKGVPTILLCKDLAVDLKFDVRGHRCLVYKSIKQLEELLAGELTSLTRK